MTPHDTRARPHLRRFDLSLLTEALDYDLKPHAQMLGGDVWLEDILPGQLIVRYQRPRGDSDDLHRWLHAALVRLFDGDEGAFDLRTA